MVTGPAPTGAQVLALPLPKDTDSGAATVKEFLACLLERLWAEKDGFSAKHPFGDDDWASELYIPMMRAGWIDGELGDDGYILDMDTDSGDELIRAAIAELCGDNLDELAAARHNTVLALISVLGDSLPEDTRAELDKLLDGAGAAP